MYQDVHWLQAHGSSESTFGFACLSYTEQSAAFIFFLLMEEQVVHNASTKPSTTFISKSLANAQFLKVASFTLDLSVLEDDILIEKKV